MGTGLGHWAAAPLLMLVCALSGGLIPALAEGAEPPESFEQLTILTSSDVGGPDLTARAMKQVLESQGIARSVRIGPISGPDYLGQSPGDTVLLGDMAMIGAAVSGHGLSALNTLVPIAQLTSDADVVVVPASSPYRSLDDLLEAMRRNPQTLRWAGESVGGADHPVMWQLARAAGVLPELMRYQSFGGASEVAAQLLDGQFNAAIAGYSVFQSAIASGRLRGLGVVSRQPIDGVSIPTFRELGLVGVSIANWCGAFAPPGTSDQQRARIGAVLRRMVLSPQWLPTLGRLHLRGAYLGASGFSLLVHQEQTRMVKAQGTRRMESYLRFWTVLWEHRLEWMMAIWGGAGILLIALCWQKLAARRREQELARTLQGLLLEVERRTQEALLRTQDMAVVRAGMNAQIEREFAHWELTPAERSVAHLMLKGLRLKEIADARKTSERTVRQQAQSIYGKAGLEGRSDLAAYFLEAVLGAPELEPPASV